MGRQLCNNQVLILVLLIVLLVPPAMVTCKTTVTINNNLGDGLSLSVHCKSKDDDLGIHVIPDGGSYSWRFRVNFWRTTLFFCGFSWKDGSGVYDIYRANRDPDRCEECNWVAQKNSLHGFSQGSSEYDLLYRWDRPSIAK